MASLTKSSTTGNCQPLQLLLLPLIALTLLPTAEAAYYTDYYYTGYYNPGYYYTGYYYTSYYFPVGGIVCSVIGALLFVGIVIALFIFFCCIRPRRMMAAQQRRPQVPMIALGAPVSSVSGQVVAGGENYPKYEPQQPLGPGGALHAPPPPYPMAPAGGSSNNGYLPPPLPLGGAVNAGYYGDYSNLPQQQQPSQAPPPYQPDAARRF